MKKTLAMLLLLCVPLMAQFAPTPAEIAIAAAQKTIDKKPNQFSGYNALAIALSRRARETSDVNFYTQAEEALKKSHRQIAQRDPLKSAHRPTGDGHVHGLFHIKRREHFENVVHAYTQLIVAGLAGFIVGQTINAWVVVRIKERTKEKHLWARLVGSTFAGQLGDTVVFCSIAASAIGISTFADFATYTHSLPEIQDSTEEWFLPFG